MLGELRPADRIDAATGGVQAAVRDPMLDRLCGKAQLEQLGSRHETVLPSGERPNAPSLIDFDASGITSDMSSSMMLPKP